ncbi:Ig-like domain-containing protein [Paucilactobacillus sp. N302-9]
MKRNSKKKVEKLFDDGTQRKEHYKLYKAGKLWLVAGVVSIAFGASELARTQEVHADTNTEATSEIANSSAQNTINQSTVTIASNTDSSDPQSEAKEPTKAVTSSASTSAAVVADTQAEVDELKNTALTAAPKDDNGNLTKPVSVAAMSSTSASDSGSVTSADANITDLNDIYKNDSNWTLTDKTANISVTTNDNKYKITLYAYSQGNVMTGADRPLVSVTVQSLEDPKQTANTYAFKQGSGHTSRYFYVDSNGKMTGFGTTNVDNVVYYINENAAGGPKLAKVMTSGNGIQIAEEVQIKLSGSISHSLKFFNKGTTVLNNVKFGVLMDTALNDDDNISIYADGADGAYITNGNLTLYSSPSDETNVYAGQFGNVGGNTVQNSYSISMATPVSAAGKDAQSVLLSNVDTTILYESSNVVTTFSTGDVANLDYAEQLFVGKEPVILQNVLVQHELADGTKIADDTTVQGQLGDTITISADNDENFVIVGYELVDPNNATYTITGDGAGKNTVTLVYKQQAVDVQVKFVDKDNKVLATDLATGAIGSEIVYDTSTLMSTLPELANYRLASNQDSKVSFIVTNNESDNVITVHLVSKPVFNVDENNNGQTTITGTTEPGSEVKITDGAGTEHTVTADDKGDFTIPNVVVDPAGEDLTVTVTDPNGNETTETVTVPEDTTAPALDVTAGTNDSGKTTITGTTEPGATVVVTDGNGKDYTVTAGDDGSFSIPDVAVNPAGDTLNVVATDLNGNTTPTTVTVNPDTTKPTVTVDPGTNNNGETTITGTTEPGSEVKITDGAGTEHTVTADDKGDFTIPNVVVDPAGEDLTVTVTDPNGNETTETVTVPEDTTAPALEVTAGTNDSGKTTITGTTEPGATVVVTDGNGKDYTATAGDDGSFSIPDVAVNPAGENLDVVATDINGNTTPTTVTVNPDTTKPTITVTVGKNVGAKTSITGVTEPGATVTLIDHNGMKQTVIADGSGNFILPEVAVDPHGEKLTITVTDRNGNAVNKVVDVPAQAPVTVEVGPAKPGDTIQITDKTNPNGSITIVVDGNGNLVDENGNVLGKLDSKGMATIALPNAIQGDTFEVTVIPMQQANDSTDKSAKSSSNSGKKEQMLPQTDEKENQAAVIGLTLLTSMLSFIGFKKKKAK